MVDDPLLGRTVLGKYRIERIIGSGGMGTVYEAEDLRLGRPVAIKVLRPAAGDFGDMGRRFRREARTIAQVTHPNLVTLLEFDLLDDGTPAMVMERVEGGSLRELMQRRPVTVDEVVEILRQSLSALGACHEAGIIHRDLKPGNLLVEDRGGELRVKIIDFGLTKITSAGGSVLTAQGEIFGSPRFMAPEQWMGQEVDGRTDLYALGLIGYYLLLGRHFIQPGNPVDVCRAHVQQPRPVLTQDQAGNPIPAAVNDAFKAALPASAVLIDMSTVSPSISARIATHLGNDTAYLRSPVSGSTMMAEAGTLTALVSGPRDAFDAMSEVFSAFTKTAFHLGPAEQARFLKLAINSMVAATSALLGEALAFGLKGGLTNESMLEVITQSVVASPLIGYKKNTIISGDYTPAATLDMLKKDVDLFLSSGKDLGMPLPIGEKVKQLYEAAASRGLGGKDFFVLVQDAARMSSSPAT